MIKEYFANYFLHQSDVTIDMTTNSMEVHNNKAEPWKITLIDTGLNSMTGGRIKRAKNYINNESFLLTYGDGVSDVNINQLIDFHKSHSGALTMTSVQPEGRFGALTIDETNKVTSFLEKPKGDGAWINGGFFVCNSEVIDYIDNDATVFEKEPLEKLAKDNKLFTFKHKGFWKPMDTMRDKSQLEELIENGTAPWMLWKK
jgi:glucose-1-phosphate cytidylyltransferase